MRARRRRQKNARAQKHLGARLRFRALDDQHPLYKKKERVAPPFLMQHSFDTNVSSLMLERVYIIFFSLMMSFTPCTER